MSGAGEQRDLCRPVPVSRLNRGPVDMVIDATPDERQALAIRFGLCGLSRLRASLRICRERSGGGDIVVAGRFQADISQACVVTLETFEAVVEEEFRLRYTTAPDDGLESFQADDVECDLDGEDRESLFGETIDAGEVVAQYFGVALDPHPRAAGAELDLNTSHDVETVDETHPLAALAALRSSRA